ncbi:hypothetical protein GCM10028803_36190 [Larkinella knui]|uniref:Uncharacterized protein n=1 Tax=Larkinella knui TaxID=2025310 RepID=A0A3P1CDR8_9BACT|nr:hypothetical protein [Larkinella knui]RRB11481.1 hypothetical protein EHT87_23680 [Larkinella knui]
MTQQQFMDFFQDVLISVYANIRDLREKQGFADPEEQDYLRGRLVSYEEILELFRMSARDTGINSRELGL